MDRDSFYKFCDSLEQTSIKLEGCKGVVDAMALAADASRVPPIAFLGVGAFMQAILEELKNGVETAFDFYRGLE